MSIDYRLLERFETSHKRHEAARLLLPEHWRSDPRPEAQTINDLWVSVIVRASEQQEEVNCSSAGSLTFEGDER